MKPFEQPCIKCGSSDIYRKYFKVGQNTNFLGSRNFEDSNEWVDRTYEWAQPAKKECICHHCRSCHYTWESDPLGANSETQL